MRITKHKDHYLLENEKGSYHLSHGQFDKMGEAEAIKLAEKEIDKKFSSTFQGDEINFSMARELGFCEYGIEDFCERLNLDIDKTYKLDDLNKALTVEMLQEYTDECLKLFGSNCLKYLGGVKGVLNEYTINLVLKPEFIPEVTLHWLATDFAYDCLPIFEEEFPEDKRPREAIEAKVAWIKGEITDEELLAAWSEAWSAVGSVESAARSARSVRSAAWSAREEVWLRQVEMILKRIGE